MTAPALPRPRPSLRRAWLRLRTMRTAIILLLVLGAASSLGSFFPQRPILPGDVIRWKERNPGWAPFVESLGLFDVFGAWWFMAIYGLLLVSLIGCVVPRARAWVRAVRTGPRPEAMPPRAAVRHEAVVAIPAEVVLDAAARVLRRRRYRIARAGASIAADKGHRREGGSLLFHVSFLVLLLGVSLATMFGHTGQVAVVEGERFTDTRIDYDSITTGRFFTGHRGFTVALDEFDVDWHANGVPKQFVSQVRVLEDEREVLEASIFVNTPLTYRGVRLYQISWGWAPEIRVTQRGRVLYDGPTVFLQRQGGWNGVVKVPGTERYQTGFELLFVPDPQRSEDGRFFNGGPRPSDPLVVFEQFVGDLGLDRPQSVFSLDHTSLTAAEVGAMRQGDLVELPDGIEVAFTGLRQYSVFQVATNPGALVLLIAAGLILVGLLPALYSSRRRIWVRADARDGSTRLQIAGQAIQRKAAFDEEFAALITDLDRDLYATIGARDG